VRKTTCSKCGKPNDRLPQKYCKVCHATYARNTRPKYNELTDLQKFKANARSYTKVYLKRKKLIKQPCQVCQSNESQMHHPDYNKPLDVIWLCREHHLAEHAKNDVIIEKIQKTIEVQVGTTVLEVMVIIDKPI